MHFPYDRRPRLETSVPDSRLLPRTRGESAILKLFCLRLLVIV